MLEEAVGSSCEAPLYALQVMWGLSPTGPFTNTVTGYSRAYIQASLKLCFL